jgi:hypothetical protein
MLQVEAKANVDARILGPLKRIQILCFGAIGKMP